MSNFRSGDLSEALRAVGIRAFTVGEPGVIVVVNFTTDAADTLIETLRELGNIRSHLGNIHSYIGRGKHESAEQNYKCSISGLIDIKESLRSLEEENKNLHKLLEESENLIASAAPLAWNANAYDIDAKESAYQWEKDAEKLLERIGNV